MSRPALEFLHNKNDPDKAAYNPEFHDVLGKSAVIFSLRSTSEAKEIPKEIFAALRDNLIKKIRGTGLYESVLTEERAEDILRPNRELNHYKDIYLDSLTGVSVSNKEISNPLGKFLEADNLLVFQLDHLPASVGKIKEIDRYIRMKLRLVDAKSGYIIWTGIIEKIGLSEEELAKISDVGLSLSNDLIDSFFNIFKRKWHKKRFTNLAKI